MATSRKHDDEGNDGPPNINVRATPTLIKLTVNLVARVVASLQETANATGDTRTDIVNRAIYLYAYIIREKLAGRRIIVQDPDTGEMREIILL